MDNLIVDIFDQKNRKTVLKRREMYKKVRISIRSTKKFEKLRAIRNLVMNPIMLLIVRLKMNLLLTNLETSLMIMSLKMPLQPRQKNCWAVQSKSCFWFRISEKATYFWSGRYLTPNFCDPLGKPQLYCNIGMKLFKTIVVNQVF